MLKVQAVLDSRWRACFTVNPEKKYALGMDKANYLGYIVETGLVRPQINKEEAVKIWLLPTSKKKVCVFLSIVGYYKYHYPTILLCAQF